MRTLVKHHPLLWLLLLLTTLACLAAPAFAEKTALGGLAAETGIALGENAPESLAGVEENGLGVWPEAVEYSVAAKGVTETVDLYRAVGIREFESVMTNKAFLPGGNSLEGRQFALTIDEALTYANADPSKVAILRATIQKDALSAFDFSKNIDPFIFKNGVVTVQPGAQSEIFHRSLISIEHAF